MRPILPVAAVALAIALPAAAALQPGAKAPDFTAQGSKAGQPFSFTLSKELKKGVVVLYFFPAADTKGCNAEAAAFAESIADFQAAGATVIGMTAGNLDKLKQMSEKECAGKFGIAAASKAVVDGYDVHLTKPDGSQTGYTSRTSFVIAPNGKILTVFTDMNYAGHVRHTLDAVKQYKAGKRRS